MATIPGNVREAADGEQRPSLGFFSYAGRLNRLRFFLWNLLPNLIERFLWKVSMERPNPDVDMALLVITIPLTTFYITTAIRRLHDLGRSGWAFCYTAGPLLLGFSIMLGQPVPGTPIAIVAGICFFWGIGGHLYLQFAKGEKASNEYGPDPLSKVGRPRHDMFFGPGGGIDMLKAFGIATLLAGAGLLTSIVTGIHPVHGSPSRDLVAEQLAAAARVQSGDLPKKIDEETTLIAIEAEGRTMTYRYVVEGTNESDLQQAVATLRPSAIREYCSDSDIRDVLRNGVTLAWDYSRGGRHAGYSMTSADCNSAEAPSGN